MTARTPEMEARYKKALELKQTTPINKLTPILDFTYWIFARNDFYHDKTDDAGYMVVLKRECSDIWLETTNNEIYEFWRVVMPLLDKKYHRAEINLEPLRSVRNIPHIQIKLLKAEMVL